MSFCTMLESSFRKAWNYKNKEGEREIAYEV